MGKDTAATVVAERIKGLILDAVAKAEARVPSGTDNLGVRASLLAQELDRAGINTWRETLLRELAPTLQALKVPPAHLAKK